MNDLQVASKYLKSIETLSNDVMKTARRPSGELVIINTVGQKYVISPAEEAQLAQVEVVELMQVEVVPFPYVVEVQPEPTEEVQPAPDESVPASRRKRK